MHYKYPKNSFQADVDYSLHPVPKGLIDSVHITTHSSTFPGPAGFAEGPEQLTC